MTKAREEDEVATGPIGTVEADQAPRQRPRKYKIRHLVFVEPLRVALEMGVDVRSMCGVWVKPFDPDQPGRKVPIVGGFPMLDYRDCKRCNRIYEARARRVWEYNQKHRESQ